MKKYLKYIITIFLMTFVIFLLQNKVEAKSYTITDMDIQSTIQQNGDVSIEQTLTYDFNGNYNGIYITIPYKVHNVDDEKVIKNNKINNNLYTGTDVNIEKVTEIKSNTEVAFEKKNHANNGNNKVYTEQKSENIFKIKIYSPSNKLHNK